MSIRLQLISLLLAMNTSAFADDRPSPVMTELHRINLERNLRWMLDRERTAKPTSAVRVGVYADAGVWHIGARSIVEALEAEGIACRVLDRSRLSDAGLKGFETLVLPGGWAPLQRDMGGESGLAAIRKFVTDGGRCVAICAGAYLISKVVKYDSVDYPYPLGLFDGIARGPVPGLAAFPTPGSAKWTVTPEGRLSGHRSQRRQRSPARGREFPRSDSPPRHGRGHAGNGRPPIG